MNRALSAALLAAASLLSCVVATDAASAETPAGSCDRACLQHIGEDYLAALGAADPHKLPLADHVRFTENGSELKLGDGLWGTVEGLQDYRLFIVDPTSGNVGVFAAVTEAGQRALVGARLKAPNGEVTEIETLVSRSDPNSGFPAVKTVELRPALNAMVPPERRASRERTIAIADSYFQGLERQTDQGVPFASDCARRENGMQTTSNPNMGNEMSKLNCQQQFATGFSKFITGLRDRRWIVDEEKGLAMAVLFFDHAGTVKSVPLRDGTTMTVPYPFTHPYSFQLFEAFKIDDAKIHEVEAILTSVPYGMGSGWEGQP